MVSDRPSSRAGSVRRFVRSWTVQRRPTRNCRRSRAASSCPIFFDPCVRALAGTLSSGWARTGVSRPKLTPKDASERRPRSLTCPSTIWSVGPRPAARATSLSGGTSSAARRIIRAIRWVRSLASTMCPAQSRSSSVQTLTVLLRCTASPARASRRFTLLTVTDSGSPVTSSASSVRMREARRREQRA